jgi:hypothetical protein
MFGGKFVKRGRKTWRYGIDEIVELTGRTENQVRVDRRSGRLVMGELRSVVCYVVGYMIGGKNEDIGKG